MTGALLGGAALLLVAATGIVLALALGVARRVEIVVAAYVIAFAEVVALALFLSLFDSFTRGAVFAAVVLTFVAAAGVWALRGAPRPPRMWAGVSFSPPLVVMGVLVALASAYVFALVVGTPPNGWDPLNYHLARAAFWTQSHRIGYIANAYDERLNFNPPNGEVGIATALSLTRNERAAGLVQFFAYLACGAAVFAFARRVGRGAAEAAFGALVFMLVPIVLLQASGSKNDVVVASFLLAAAVFVVGRSRADLVVAAVATALAVGAKFTAAYGLIVLAALSVLATPRSRWWWRCLALGAGALAGSYWYVVNRHETGMFLGDQSGTGTLTAPFDPQPNLVTLYGDALDTLDLSGARGKSIVFFAVAALVVAAALALRRHARAALAAAALVAGAMLLVPLSHAGRSGLLHVYDALGRPPAYLAEGDPVTASPTNASDTGSWFGPAGLVLAAAAIVAVHRRRLPPPAVVAAYAPVAWLLFVALTLTYHPWQGRFFVFPFALSAALWGVSLRSRALTWAVVALAGLTATLSLVHYDEKPSSVWGMPRWEVQSQHDPPSGPAFRFVDENVPAHDAIAIELGPNEFGFPFFGPHLTRRVELAPAPSVRWLFADTQRSADVDRRCWRARLETERGTVFQRVAACA